MNDSKKPVSMEELQKEQLVCGNCGHMTIDNVSKIDGKVWIGYCFVLSTTRSPYESCCSKVENHTNCNSHCIDCTQRKKCVWNPENLTKGEIKLVDAFDFIDRGFRSDKR